MKEASYPLCFPEAYVCSYFNWYTAEDVFDSYAIAKAP